MDAECKREIGRDLGIAVLVAACLFITSCATTTPMTPLHKAAIQGDVDRIEEYVKKGIPVNKQDELGNTPLHYAYYHGQKEAIDRLTAYGADMTIRNKDGDTPMDMQNIARAENLLRSGAQVMDDLGNWTDRSTARPIYDELKRMEGNTVTKAIVRKVIKDDDRLRVLFVAVKLGIAGSEQRLNDVLYSYGDKSMAEDYLNSGSQSLYEGGRRWANSHGYYISTGMGSNRVGWGRF
jgi:hypothetical protein